MTFVQAAWLGLAALAIVVVLLHVHRRKTFDVPSVQIWRALAARTAPRRRLNPPPISLPLVLQVLAVVLLTIALAEPRLGGDASGHRVYILDGSASMQATDAAPSRFAAAVERLADEIAADPPSSARRVSILVASPVPEIVAARLGESGALVEKVRSLRSSDGVPDWARTLDFARAVVRAGEPTTIAFLGDGPAPPKLADFVAAEAAWSLEPLPFGTADAANVGFASLSATEVAERPGRWSIEGDVRIAADPDPDGSTTIPIRVLFRPEGSSTFLPWSETSVAVRADATSAHFRTEVAFPDSGALQVELPEDSGPHDNRAGLVLTAERRPFAILLVGTPGAAVLRALQALPETELFAADQLPPDAAGFDLVVVENVAVPRHPGASTIWLGNAGIAGEPAPTVRSGVRPTGWTNDHPLSTAISWGRLEIAAGYERQPREGTEVLLESGSLPLVEARRGAGFSDVWVSFEIGDSNWPTLASFPAFFANVVEWVGGPAETTAACRVGLPCPIAQDEVTPDTQLLAPDDTVLPFAGTAFVPVRTGFHRIVTGGSERLIAVNGFFASESDLRVDGVAALSAPPPAGSPHPWWILAIVVLGLLILEAWIAGRGSERFLTARALGGGNPLAGRHRLAIGLRAASALLLVLAIAGMPRPGIGPDEHIAVVASDGAAPVEAIDADPASGGNAGLARVTLAAHPALSSAFGEVAEPNGIARLAGADADVALAVAVAAIPPGESGRIVLATDGVFTRGSVSDRLAALADGPPLDVSLLPNAVEGDVAVGMLSASSAPRSGERFPLVATIVADRRGEAEVTIFRDGTVVGTETAMLSPGTNRVETEVHEEDDGQYLYEIAVAAAGDPIAENNRNGVLVEVKSSPRVGVITPPGEQGAAETLIRALEVQGLSAELVPTTHTVWTVADWLRFDEIVLMNVPAIDLDTRQQEAIEAVVEEHGRGLIILGGENSFGPGGYYETPLERLSPLSSRIPRDAPRVALVFVLDRSGSMTQRVGDASRLDVAKSATMSALELLNEESQVGVVVFDSEATAVVPLQERLDAPAVEAALAPLVPGGGTNIYPGLVEAQAMLEGVDAAARHIIVMTDGLSQPGEFRRVLQELRDEGITVSTVAIGDGADAGRLQEIARLGDGTFHATRDFAALPSILSQEALLLSGTPVKYQSAQPFWLDREEPFLTGLPEAMPPVLGYVLTTAKEEANLHLAVPDDEGEIAPILASWRYGNGHVLALATHGAGDWTARWLDEPAYPLFWSQVVRSFLPETQGPGPNLALARSGDTIHVRVDALDRSGEPRTGLEIEAEATVPGLSKPLTIMLAEVDRGRYEGAFNVDGTGAVTVDVAVEGERARASTLIAYPALFEANRKDPSRFTDRVAASGGRVVGGGEALDLDPGWTFVAASGWRLWAMLALLVFLADLAVRYAPGLLGRVGKRQA